ncbi:hypothetical protein [Adhaeretor mobilis]|uniref:PEP-CTERM protein-sorting domain-containing protein n=1 Tax=Adhaeretor mobilis TaxID=1930276 RepID=A0A517N2S1_9BACT|nr:hypothetical protein [Adhaeretor mobilis]QDT01432.1 hypothetical protein HG15A2_47740 [Adhaeretor mobilis]
MRRFLAALLLSALCTISTGYGAEPNDDFGSATVLGPGVISVLDSLEGFPSPDTYLGAFADDTFSLPTLDEDDDSSPLGDGLGSGIFGVGVNADGSIHLAVTGCCDDFDGTHSEDGDYELFVEVFDAGGAPLDSFSVPESLTPGELDTFSFDDPTWVGGFFDAITDNALGLGTDPLDYWRFTGLTPGESFVAETSDTDFGIPFDTMLAWVDEFGDIIVLDDDGAGGGDGLKSRVMGTVPASGEVVLAVTGYSDFDLFGEHGEIGDYELTIFEGVPEPSTLLLATVCLAWAVGSHRRRFL